MTDIRYVTYNTESQESIQHIRHTVFTGEQQVDPAIDFDGQDSLAIHVLLFVRGRPAATGRMLSDGHIGRVAVLKEYRGMGMGRQVISALEEYAAKNHYPRIYLGSQLHAQPFYSKLGFTPYGEQYTEANIEHISMQKRLA